MNGKDALTAKGLARKQKKDKSSDSQGKKKDRKDPYSKNKANKSSPDTPKKKMNFTLLVMLADKILMQIMDELGLKLPKPLRTSSKKRDLKKFCRFHKDHGHYSDEYHDLKEQIEELIQRGKLQKFFHVDHHPQMRIDDKCHDDAKDDGRDHPKQAVGEIRMIFGGPVSRRSYKSSKKTHHRQINSVDIKHLSLKYQ